MNQVKKIWANWSRLSDVGTTLMLNPLALVGPGFILGPLGMKFMQPTLVPMVGLTVFVIACVVVAIVSAILWAFFTSPLWGMYYLRQIERDFGPKTRTGVWDWFGRAPGQDEVPLNMHRIAWECGETRLKPGSNQSSGRG